MTSADLYLRKGADRRLRGGHLWIYSNEIDSKRSSLGSFAPGEPVCVRSAEGKLLGSAYMEPQSLICARMFAPGEQRSLDFSLILQRLKVALAGRDAFFDQPFYRLVYGDSDLLPGIVIDRFGPYLVVQLNNAGVERYRQPLLDALVDLLKPEGVLLRGDSRSRRESGLAVDVEVVLGDVPERVPVEENGVKFLAPVHSGQKTGWFYDHRMARARLQPWVQDKSVLDVYSYIGGWGIQAGVFGASSVCCLDSSAAALEGVMVNAGLNGLADQVSIRQGSAPETMAQMRTESLSFDVVILDPPAFIQRRKDLKKGLAAYRRINELGLRLLKPGGLLVSASCSMHLSRADLFTAMQQAAVRADCQLRVVEQGAQGPDHPIHPAIPETEYLKAVFARRVG
ncbi:class I SAM-dependent rRNA methyltransferase [Pseudohalioglobus lutimaris]|uniref:RlmI/RlmK family 23S rRNA methyltransferase n=1 Tax=Pseudohalioglobus lutimaris TaxID=1737061 RepID=A0A2N5X3T8_9GAMM|nr:class I SAM-dependent rRNA methyltransferase [Pseudohalioglobus lutimaris]PLW69130.1 RlmI/RlmK family 23S rRNA methyltransferase [Pseudohalioglobus lutimaris]